MDFIKQIFSYFGEGLQLKGNILNWPESSTDPLNTKQSIDWEVPTQSYWVRFKLNHSNCSISRCF